MHVTRKNEQARVFRDREPRTCTKQTRIRNGNEKRKQNPNNCWRSLLLLHCESLKTTRLHCGILPHPYVCKPNKKCTHTAAAAAAAINNRTRIVHTLRRPVSFRPKKSSTLLVAPVQTHALCLVLCFRFGAIHLSPYSQICTIADSIPASRFHRHHSGPWRYSTGTLQGSRLKSRQKSRTI